MPRAAKKLALPLLLLALAVVAVIGLAGRRAELTDALRQLSWPAVALALLFGLVGVGFMLLSWAVAVKDAGADLPLRDLARIYCVGQVGKYLPGSVWPVVTQARLANRRGASASRVASGSLLNLAITVAVVLAFGGALLPFSGDQAAQQLWWAPVLAVPMVGVLHPAVLNRLLALAGKVLKRDQLEIAFTTRGVLLSAGWALLGSIAFGAHVFALAHALGVHGVRGFVLSTCAYALASGVGVLVILAPAGAGVREAVLTAVLAPVLSVEAAVVIALASRALFIVIDLGLGASQVWGLRHWKAAA